LSYDAINEILTYEIMYLVVMVFSIMFLLYVMINIEKSKLKNYYITIHTLILLALICSMIVLVTPTINILNIVLLIKYLVISVFLAVFISFCNYYAKKKKLRPFYIILLSILPVITFLAIITNSMHGLFFSKVTLEEITPNILFYAHSIIGDLYILFGLILFVWFNSKKKTLKTKKINFYFIVLIL